jgi:hypothetical protein
MRAGVAAASHAVRSSELINFIGGCSGQSSRRSRQRHRQK